MKRYETLQQFKEEFPSMFCNHKAEITKLDGNNGRDCIIKFEVDGTSVYAMMFTYINGVLSVSGDYGYAVFNWYNRNNSILVYPSFKDISYVLSKIVASEEIHKFSQDFFYDDFRDVLESLKEGGYIDDSSSIDYFSSPENSCEVIEFVRRVANDLGIDVMDMYEMGAEYCGQYISNRAFIWWYGLGEAVKQLEDNGYL